MNLKRKRDDKEEEEHIEHLLRKLMKETRDALTATVTPERLQMLEDQALTFSNDGLENLKADLFQQAAMEGIPILKAPKCNK
ncbi:hypothetical protein HDU96_003698, partial [Phlyctochytrium bullatum]